MENTSIKLRNRTIYQVFVRNHTKEGTFRAVIRDLPRIRELGTDIVYLLPVHPIGEKRRKGTMGSPYAIRDYNDVSPDLGTMDDFRALIDATHRHGMQVMMDIVFNHTAWDSVLLGTHPEWFHRDKDGELANRVGDWWDIVDLDFTDKGLWKTLIDVLVAYAGMGVDGFRCDVASLIPLDFWKQARAAVDEVRPDVIWLAETVHTEFCKSIRDRGHACASEGEMHQVFDMTYDYDLFPFMSGVWEGRCTPGRYIDRLNEQDGVYPQNYVKIRFLENHDQPRIADVMDGNREAIITWTIFMFLQKGAAFIYAGQEFLADRRPDLFEKDPVKKNEDIQPLIRTLTTLKEDPLFARGAFVYEIIAGDIIHQTITDGHDRIDAYFNVGATERRVSTELPDGTYPDLVLGHTHAVTNQTLAVGPTPAVIRRRHVHHD